jgi:hypothetical protein
MVEARAKAEKENAAFIERQRDRQQRTAARRDNEPRLEVIPNPQKAGDIVSIRYNGVDVDHLTISGPATNLRIPIQRGRGQAQWSATFSGQYRVGFRKAGSREMDEEVAFVIR